MPTKLMPAKDHYTAEFARLRETLAGSEIPWLRELRESAIERVSSLGFPTRQEEEWRHTDITPITRTPFQLTSSRPADFGDALQLDGALLEKISPARVVFLNGVFSKELSQGVGDVEIASLAEALKSDPAALKPHLARLAPTNECHTFVALNTAFFADGAFVVCPRGQVAKEPLHLLFVTVPESDPVVTHPRVLILAERDSRIQIVEEYIGLENAPSLTNAVVEVAVGENADLQHVKLQREQPASHHMATLAVQQSRNSQFQSHSISLGGRCVRNDIKSRMVAEGAECSLNGLYVVAGEQLVDHHTTVEHSSPRTASRQLYKGVLDDRARGVFNGRVIVRPDAQKIDAEQTNRNLLLSGEALVHSNPQLEIFANDVKCKHGSSIGQVSDDEIFYVRSRGIDEQAALELLITAFANEMTERLPLAPLRTAVAELTASALSRKKLP